MTLVLKVNCRTCNRECGDYKHLMEETLVDNESTTLAALLNYCTSLEICDDNDYNMPKHICNSCVEHLLQSYIFKEMVLQTDYQLRQRIKEEQVSAKERKKRIIYEETLIVEQEIDVEGIDEEITNNKQQRIHVAKWASVSSPNSHEQIEVYNEQQQHQEGTQQHDQFEQNHQEEDKEGAEEVREEEDELADTEYEMEEWLEAEDVVEEVASPELNELHMSGTCLLNEVKTEQLTDNEIIDNDLGNGSLIETNTVGEDEDDEEDEEQLEPLNRENKENSQTNVDIAEEVNTEDDGEYEIITGDSNHNNTNSTKKKATKRTSLKSGHVTLADLLCKHCGKQFDKMCRLREHTYMHTGEKPHVCNVCGKRSRTKTHHNVHMLTHSDEKRYKCTTCGQFYRTSNSLRVHERKHTDVRPYSCPMCEKSYHTAEQCKLHVMLHTGERPHRCDKCGKAYRESYSLRLHMHTHENKKPYQCEICGKGLTQMSGYKRHMLLHTGEYPYKCDVCGRAFRISSNLLAHKRLHLDVLPHQCTQCHKGFTTTTRLKRHMLLHNRSKDPKDDVFRSRRQRVSTTHVEQKISRSKVVEIL